MLKECKILFMEKKCLTFYNKRNENKEKKMNEYLCKRRESREQNVPQPLKKPCVF